MHLNGARGNAWMLMYLEGNHLMASLSSHLIYDYLKQLCLLLLQTP